MSKVTSCLKLYVKPKQKCLVRQSSLQTEIGQQSGKGRLPETILKEKRGEKRKNIPRGWSNNAVDCKIHSRCFSRQSNLQTISSIAVANWASPPCFLHAWQLYCTQVTLLGIHVKVFAEIPKQGVCFCRFCGDTGRQPSVQENIQ